MSSTSNYQVVAEIVEQSPLHKKISHKFYVWFIAYRKGTMKGLWMSVKYIAKEVGCSPDTILRFFKQYPHLVKRKFRKNQTNIYEPQESFIHAMQFLDQRHMLERSQKTQKRWLQRLFKKEFESYHGNVQICDPLCPDLRPNPLLYPRELKRSSTTQSAVRRQDGFFLNTGKLLSGINASEGAVRYINRRLEILVRCTAQEYNWFSNQAEISNPEACLITIFQRTEERHVKTTKWKRR